MKSYARKQKGNLNMAKLRLPGESALKEKETLYGI